MMLTRSILTLIILPGGIIGGLALGLLAIAYGEFMSGYLFLAAAVALFAVGFDFVMNR